MFRDKSRLVCFAVAVCTIYAGVAQATDRNGAFVGYAERAGSAGGGCLDSNELCQTWADGGECERNPGYMETCVEAVSLIAHL